MADPMADDRAALAPGRRRRVGGPRRWRVVWQAVGVGVGLLLLLWGADSLARLGAESLLQRNIQTATGVSDPPQVTVHGVFFLPQVIRGSYDQVDVTTRGITSGPLRIEELDSQLFDVRVPFHDVLLRNVRRIGIGRSVEHVTLTYADLNAYLDATGRPLRLSAGPDGRTVTISGTVSVLGQTLQASADVDLSVDNGALHLSPQQIDTGSSTLDQASRLLLRQRLTLTVPLGALPFGHTLTAVTADPDGLRVSAEGASIIVEP
jgi:hypothetical protein